VKEPFNLLNMHSLFQHPFGSSKAFESYTMDIIQYMLNGAKRDLRKQYVLNTEHTSVKNCSKATIYLSTLRLLYPSENTHSYAFV
jgi:hypothetical protein